MELSEESYRHKFLLIYGQNQRRVLVTNKSVRGTSKQELLGVVCTTFGVKEEDIIMQTWQDEFNDFADMEEDELVTGPLRVRITDKLPVVLSAQQLVNGGEVNIVSQMQGAGEISEDINHFSVKQALSVQGGTSACTGTPVAKPASSSGAEDAAFSGDTDKEDAVEAVEAVQSSSGRTAGARWLTNFVLPKQPPTIENKALLGGAGMTESERGIFLDNIYVAVVKLNQNYYPSPTLYNQLCDAIFSRYPRMALPQPNMPVGTMKALWKNRLMYKFRNNRKRKDAAIPAVVEKKKKNILPGRKISVKSSILPRWGMPFYLPEREASEDDGSIEGHIEWMSAEKRKRQPDFKRVNFAMQKTLADRREWIVNSVPRPRITDVHIKYPWLFDEDQLAAEMERLQGTQTPLQEQLREGLKKYERVLLQKGQAQKRPHRHFTQAVKEIQDLEGDLDKKDATSRAAFVSIPGLLQESVDNIFLLPEAETTIPIYIQCNKETLGKTSKFTLMADGEEVMHSASFFGAVASYFAAFYVFNWAYPGVIQHTLTFVQKIILQIQDELPATKPVITLTNKLNVLNNK